MPFEIATPRMSSISVTRHRLVIGDDRQASRSAARVRLALLNLLTSQQPPEVLRRAERTICLPARARIDATLGIVGAQTCEHIRDGGTVRQPFAAISASSSGAPDAANSIASAMRVPSVSARPAAASRRSASRSSSKTNMRAGSANASVSHDLRAARTRRRIQIGANGRSWRMSSLPSRTNSSEAENDEARTVRASLRRHTIIEQEVIEHHPLRWRRPIKTLQRGACLFERPDGALAPAVTFANADLLALAGISRREDRAASPASAGRRSSGCPHRRPRSATSRPMRGRLTSCCGCGADRLEPAAGGRRAPRPVPPRPVHRAFGRLRQQQPRFQEGKPRRHHEIIGRQLQAGSFRASSIKARYCSARARTEIRARDRPSGGARVQAGGRAAPRTHRHRRETTSSTGGLPIAGFGIERQDLRHCTHPARVHRGAIHGTRRDSRITDDSGRIRPKRQGGPPSNGIEFAVGRPQRSKRCDGVRRSAPTPGSPARERFPGQDRRRARRWRRASPRSAVAVKRDIDAGREQSFLARVLERASQRLHRQVVADEQARRSRYARG